MKIIIIAAVAKNGVIGNENELCWHIPEDMKRFRDLTTNNVVLFGRKTWEGLLNKPLPGRINFLLTTTNPDLAYGINNENLHSSDSLRSQDRCFTYAFYSVDLLLQFWRLYYQRKNLFICGGANVYEQFLSLADEIQLTFVNKEPEGDTYFPQWDRFKYLSEWDKEYEFISVSRERKSIWKS